MALISFVSTGDVAISKTETEWSHNKAGCASCPSKVVTYARKKGSDEVQDNEQPKTHQTVLIQLCISTGFSVIYLYPQENKNTNFLHSWSVRRIPFLTSMLYSNIIKTLYDLHAMSRFG